MLPPELTGRYLRNGPNPLPGEPSAHWFTGHGMVHGIRLREGRAEWYRNRWVRTKALAGQSMFGPQGIDRSVGVANTHVVAHAGRIMALVESSFPHVLTPELGTVGPLRLRRSPHHRDDGPPQDRPGHRGAALLRLRRSRHRSSPTTGSRPRASS